MKRIKTFESFLNEKIKSSTPETSAIITSFIMTHHSYGEKPKDMEAAVSEILYRFEEDRYTDFYQNVKTYYPNASLEQCEDLYDDIDASMK